MSVSTPSIVRNNAVQVAVGVIHNDVGQVLIAQRARGSVYEGKWEFPGGKIREGETVKDALHRELHEELGIDMQTARPLIRIRHHYPEKKVILDVWSVDRYKGIPTGRERQAIRWVAVNQLTGYDFLSANRPIIQSLCLPPLYLITDATRFPENDFFPALEQALRAGARLIQIREHRLPADHLRRFANETIALCHRYGARVLINADPNLAVECGADGVHLNSRRLMQITHRPLSCDVLVAASCHDMNELKQAESAGVDFAILAPVLRSASHPNPNPLGWERFRKLCDSANFPVYALGGMRPADLAQARSMGAQGISMISGVWDAPSIEEVVSDCVD